MKAMENSENVLPETARGTGGAAPGEFLRQRRLFPVERAGAG
jgi:hypothetical protein